MFGLVALVVTVVGGLAVRRLAAAMLAVGRLAVGRLSVGGLVVALRGLHSAVTPPWPPSGAHLVTVAPYWLFANPTAQLGEGYWAVIAAAAAAVDMFPRPLAYLAHWAWLAVSAAAAMSWHNSRFRF